MGRSEMFANVPLELGHALRRRRCPQIRFAIPPMPVQAEAVAQELEPFPPRVLEPGLDLVQGQPKPGYRTARPAQRLSRFPAT